ncbi:MAG TPA: PilZ domain-containing protein [Chthoniobacterales bacterium]|nr:PilZ domain-containing protein [Chthoniobacterales bacterium]
MGSSQPKFEDARRSEPRIPIDIGAVPFLGSRENGHSTFCFLLRDVSSSGVGVIVPLGQGMIPLEHGETVNFHLPFQLNKEFYNEGVIRWQQMIPEGQACGARLEKRVPLRYPIYVAFESGDIRFVTEEFGIPSLEKLVIQILEDAYYFKKGVGIYFEHLAPYFARHSQVKVEKRSPTDEDLVTCVRSQIRENIRIIEKLKTKASEGSSNELFPSIADLESLRAATALELNLEVLSESFSASTMLPYLQSVGSLSHQLYTNFNTLVLVHLHTRGRRIAPRTTANRRE